MRGPAPGLGRLLTLVGLAAAAVYIFTLQYDFVWDDEALVSENAYIRSPRVPKSGCGERQTFRDEGCPDESRSRGCRLVMRGWRIRSQSGSAV